MALVTVQRSPSPSASAETEEQDIVDGNDSNLKSPRQRRRSSKSALKKLRKLFNTVRFVTKLKPCLSESYFTVKGAALILPQSDYNQAYSRKVTKSHDGDIQSHLQAMFSLLRPQDTIKVAVKLEGRHTRYLVVVSCTGREDTEESVILGIDLVEKATIGMVMPVWANTHIQLDGDGGFSIQVDNNIHIFKPVSVQAMWSALQSINKVKNLATEKLYIPRGLTHTWVGYYEAKLTTDVAFLNEWHQRSDIDRSYRHTDASAISDSDEESIYKVIKTELKNVMMTVDLEDVTCLFLRKTIEQKMGMDLKKYRSFIDTEMIEILGQMDAPSKILDYLYLGSEWNASNLEELQQNGVFDILNISREIDNFFPGILNYMNVREWDVEITDLLKHWKDTHKFINRARKHGSKVLVHCKMGISRSASTVIAYLMKENKWSLQQAHDFTKSKRSIINPNQGFMKQLEMYEGILNANWHRPKFDRNAPVHSLTTLKETDDPILDQLESPEAEFLAKKHDQGPGDIPFIHTEQDIDIASRSADSTDDSLPDNLSPNPTQSSDATGEVKKHHHRRKHDSDKAESGDYLSSDSSEYSDSIDSTSTDDDEDNNLCFPPIDKPELDLPLDFERRQKPIKVEARRTKSEGDKHTLSVDKQCPAFSREGSVSKYKPDGSWIKLETEGENNETEPGADKEMELSETDDAKSDDTGIWMKKQKDETKPGAGVIEEIEENENEQQQSDDTDSVMPSVKTAPGDNEADKMEESSSIYPYIRENIPWNPGTVRKQKQDLEEKFGSSGAEIKKIDSVDLDEQKCTSTSDSESSVMEPVKICSELSNQKTEPMECEIVIQSEESQMETDQSGVRDDDKETGSSEGLKKSRRSVYDLEEIDLPEGTVKKTMMEIEERNRLSVETPGKRLQRSSSLKSSRITPKAKDRDNERRKTCIAILSPSQPDFSQTDSVDFEKEKLDLSGSNFNIMRSRSSPGLLDGVMNQASQASYDAEEEEDNLTGTVKIYKFMGEELSVQEGLVRKQTKDIEHKATVGSTAKRPISKSVIEPSLLEHVPALYASSSVTCVNSKQATPSSASISPSESMYSYSNSAHIFDGSDSNTKAVEAKHKNENIDESSIPKVENIKATFTEKGVKSGEINTDTVLYRGASSTTAFLKKYSPPQSRFDPETLELIREIGSALLNSPAKAELDDEKEEELEGRSLVSHFVKKIERNTKYTKKKPSKEIIIIDKDPKQTQEQKSALDMKNVSKTDSKLSPVAKKQIFSASPSLEESPGSPKSASPKWSPVFRKDMSPISEKRPSQSKEENKAGAKMPEKQQTSDRLDLSLNLQTITSPETKSENAETPSLIKEETAEACSVRNLVGKFEPVPGSGKVTPVFGMPNVQSPSSNTQLFPGAKMDIGVIELQRPCSRGSTGGLDTGGQASSQRSTGTPMQQRQSEPIVQLSEKSIMLLDTRLREMGESLCCTDSLNKNGGAVRPKSADLSQKQAQGRRNYGAKLKLGDLRQSQTLPETDQQQFTWEGKKVRKLYGKSHPLAKLEDKQYMESNIRSNPFYNTM